MKVYYGWTKVNKVKKREAISVIYENERLIPSRSEWSLRAAQKTVYVREQTRGEEEDGRMMNRVYTEYSIFMDSKEVRGSLEKALQLNYDADRNNVKKGVREEIREALRKQFMMDHPKYREGGYQLSIDF